jgi:hypothetical protein
LFFHERALSIALYEFSSNTVLPEILFLVYFLLTLSAFLVDDISIDGTGSSFSSSQK